MKTLAQVAGVAVALFVMGALYGHLSHIEAKQVRDSVDEQEERFSKESGLIFRNRSCDENDGDNGKKVCWFSIPTFSPAFGCKHNATVIYRCTSDGCVWLEEP